jgi:hypothetical protein
VGRLIPFEYCDKKVTPWGGMRLIKGYLNRCGLYDKLRELDFQIPGSAVGVPHHEIIESFMMSVILGAGNCSNASHLGNDDVIKEIFQWDKGMPSQSSLSRFFPKYDHDSSDAIFSDLLAWWFEQLGRENLTLDIDSTVMVRYGDQEGAEVGYNAKKPGRKSHHPIIAFVAEPKMVANAWMRAGDSASSTEFREFLDDTFTKISADRIGLIRADSGFSGNAVLNEIERRQKKYIIAMPFKAGLVETLLAQENWLNSDTEGVEFCSFQYKAKSWGQFRRIVAVRKDTGILTKCGGRTLFREDDDYFRYKYSAYVTNVECSEELVWLQYKQRANAENQIKELYYDYCMNGFCFEQIHATEFAFRWLMMAYNFMSYVRNEIKVGKVTHTLSTLRYNCIAIGAYLTSSGRTKKLIIAASGKKRDYIDSLFEKLDPPGHKNRCIA